MEKNEILAKARLSSTYTASDEFFSDLENCKWLGGKELLEVYDIWQHWLLRLRSIHLAGLKQISRTQEELQNKQRLTLEFYFLDSDFLPKLTNLVEEYQESLVLYGKDLLVENDAHLREILLLQGALRLLANHRVARTETTDKFTQRVNSYVAELKKHFNLK